MYELEGYLAEITGMDAVTLQPAAGAHGELAGMLLIHAYHNSKGAPAIQDHHPRYGPRHQPGQCSAVRLPPGPDSVQRRGVLTAEALRASMDEETAGIMVTNPNTLGLFEEEHPGDHRDRPRQRRPGLLRRREHERRHGHRRHERIGVDVLHLNLHKTFSTPHGGGGPGSGPVCVNRTLEPFLPVPRVVKEGDIHAFRRVSASPSARWTPFTAISGSWSGPTATSGAWGPTV